MSKNNENSDGSFMSVLLALKENAMYNTNVAELMIVNGCTYLVRISEEQVEKSGEEDPEKISLIVLQDLAINNQGNFYTRRRGYVLFKFYTQENVNGFIEAVKQANNGIELKQINDTFSCTPLNNSKENIEAIALDNLTINVGDCVLIIFNNTNFHINLEKFKREDTLQDAGRYVSHSKENGIIIGTISAI